MDDPIPPNPYKALGVTKDANLATIRSAHRKLVLACHPDKVKVNDDVEKKAKADQFHQVQQAYEILSDDTKRQRYDDRARLAELREHMDDRPPARRASDYTAPRSTQTPTYEVRGGRVYEERAPNPSRTYQDDNFASRFADYRPSAKKYDEMFGEATPRKTSGRAQEDKRKMREMEVEQDRKAREAARKAEEASIREQRDRKRAKDRKRDVEAKSRGKFTYVEDDSDSELDNRYYARRDTTPPNRRYEEVRRKDRDEPKRNAKRDVSDYFDMESKASAAREHITRSREVAREVEIEPRSRASRPRASSNLDRPPAPEAPAIPSPRPVDSRRKSSDRERSDKERSGGEKDRQRGHGSRVPSPVRTGSSKKEKKFEDPPSRKPAMPNFTSDPKGLKSFLGSSRKEPQRSATFQPVQEFKHPGMRRSETLPVHTMRRSDPQPSNLRNAKGAKDYSDSDSSDTSDSDDTPEVRPRYSPRQTSSTKYKVTEDDGPRTMFMEPEEVHVRPRDDSPKGRRSSDRPSTTARGSSTRTPATRGSSFVAQEDRPSARRSESARIPPLSTHGSSRGKKLFGAVEEYSSTDDYSKSSPKLSPLQARGAKGHSRRSSEDVDRDAYPGSMNKSHRRPGYQRNESVY